MVDLLTPFGRGIQFVAVIRIARLEIPCGVVS